MNSEIKILIIEDEAPIQRFLTVLISGYEYQVKVASTAEQGLHLVANWNPHLILLDLGLPDQDGISLTRELRAWTQTPIMVISAREKEADKVQALDAGANDYLTKPFGSEELMARIRVALRLAPSIESVEQTRFELGDLVLDLVLKQVTKAGDPVKLTKTEYNILKLLAKNMGKVLTHKQILKEVWGGNYVEHHHYVRIHVAQLRHKVEDNPAQPRFILTENGVGYRLVDK
ncbi:response regulator [Vibrio cholerae]|uniref:DNA-binding response regulator n=1 Tax=Vibrio cholerae TaxID=666 RepID=A0A395UFL9_VIBCL|nr:response regulator [Vibrio cholerae]EGR0581867.1 response regulator [Vibrio cholerae]EGR1071669.1 response regulator [Vibrio cholerae]EJL6522739.1 response regulator [Vibrio cholerae]MBO1367632.1 DNA-binding response regulator [Vibrio cholerae]MBO1371465.1 DNA-binding response regulator [Vibrio cholerae]